MGALGLLRPTSSSRRGDSGTPSFSAFHTQTISIALHSAVARQIAVYAGYVVGGVPGTGVLCPLRTSSPSDPVLAS
eukprot:6180205-Pleurochrysis_carterae.AAC.2